jgi:peptidylprolyl isomerase
MSKSPRTPQPERSNALPGIISAAVVLVVLGIVAGILINRAAPAASTPATQADNSAAAFDPSAEAAVPTIPAEVPSSAPAVTEPLGTPPDPLPTASTYSYDSPPPLEIDPAGQYTATILTPRGEIVVELLPEIAPQTVNNFVFLARQNFYNGLTWHRVLENFMAQGGDPLGDGTGDAGYSIPAEFSNEVTFDQPGMLAMARSQDPDSAGSQFFITTGPAPWLNEQYTIFGRVVSGQEIVNGIPLRDPQNPADLGTPGETILGVTISEG